MDKVIVDKKLYSKPKILSHQPILFEMTELIFPQGNIPRDEQKEVDRNRSEKDNDD